MTWTWTPCTSPPPPPPPHRPHPAHLSSPPPPPRDPQDSDQIPKRSLPTLFLCPQPTPVEVRRWGISQRPPLPPPLRRKIGEGKGKVRFCYRTKRSSKWLTNPSPPLLKSLKSFPLKRKSRTSSIQRARLSANCRRGNSSFQSNLLLPHRRAMPSKRMSAITLRASSLASILIFGTTSSLGLPSALSFITLETE
jgi:hypothetical protein